MQSRVITISYHNEGQGEEKDRGEERREGQIRKTEVVPEGGAPNPREPGETGREPGSGGHCVEGRMASVQLRPGGAGVLCGWSDPLRVPSLSQALPAVATGRAASLAQRLHFWCFLQEDGPSPWPHSADEMSSGRSPRHSVLGVLAPAGSASDI